MSNFIGDNFLGDIYVSQGRYFKFLWPARPASCISFKNENCVLPAIETTFSTFLLTSLIKWILGLDVQKLGVRNRRDNIYTYCLEKAAYSWKWELRSGRLTSLLSAAPLMMIRTCLWLRHSFTEVKGMGQLLTTRTTKLLNQINKKFICICSNDESKQRKIEKLIRGKLFLKSEHHTVLNYLFWLLRNEF